MTPREPSDAAVRRALKAQDKAFSIGLHLYDKFYVIRDSTLPYGKDEIWRGPYDGNAPKTNAAHSMLAKLRMRRILRAAYAVDAVPPGGQPGDG